jgi:hypothetical protein
MFPEYPQPDSSRRVCRRNQGFGVKVKRQKKPVVVPFDVKRHHYQKASRVRT